ncbi:MAG TPA: M23 family metallopeptidase [Bacteriovoracaceae bacterium]|nr:M23 family metallopeptidase [Bacteriovoracaceae bacterium]
MKFFLILTMLISSAFAHEKSTVTKANKLAFGVFEDQLRHPWPFPLLSIGHSMQSYQNYGSSPYWHDGLDIRSVSDQPIYAAAGGKVVNVENYVRGNHLYWEVAILDADGFVWKYHHVAKESIPVEITAAYQQGTKIPTGTFLGNVVKWPVTTYGEVYHHLHLLVVASDGKYINPFLLMEPLADTSPPVISKIGLAKNHRPVQGAEVSGPHALYLEASDLTLHDKFLLPPYKISYRLDNAGEVLVWEFKHLPSGTNDLDYINDFYMEGTCGNYSCRKFFFNLNFTTAQPRKTLNVSKGEHEVEVTVEDIVGNRSAKTFRWKVL